MVWFVNVGQSNWKSDEELGGVMVAGALVEAGVVSMASVVAVADGSEESA